MKQVSIIPAGNRVTIDGESRPVDCTMLDPVIHATQWDEERQSGHVEFVDEDPNDGYREPNIALDSIALYQFLIDEWEAYVPPPPPDFTGMKSTKRSK